MDAIRKMVMVLVIALTSGAVFANSACDISESCRVMEAVVAVDVGHSRAASGATSARGTPEFDFNLALAKEIHQSLETKSVHAFLIGDQGDMTSLARRTALAAEHGATFFLSVHHDSVQPQYLQSWEWNGVDRNYADGFSGYSLFVSRKTADLGRSLQCAGALGAQLQQAGMQPSPHHAEAIPGENREWADRQRGVYYYDNLAVLRTATMPAVLLEAGVIVNREEEERLLSAATRRAIADAVVRGLANCGAIKLRP